MARLKFAPVYLIHWLSQQRTIWCLSLQDLVSVPFQRFHLPADTFLVDADWYRAMNDDTAGWAEPNYSIPAELRPH